MFNDKTVVLGVTGGIASYKTCEIVSALKKKGFNVEVIMTPNATKFVSPLTFETLSENRVVVDMFDRNFNFDVEHISLAKKADVFVIAPATANIIGKIACGIADDMLSTTIMATKAPKIICPAMNTAMYENQQVVENLKKLSNQGFQIVEPISGRLACGDIGKGKMAEPLEIVKAIECVFSKKQDYIGKKLLITAGATEEKIDGVRYITNYSSGKMGLAIAKRAVNRGASVTLVAGRVSVDIPDIFDKVVRVKSTADMFDAVMGNYADNQIIIKSAAPSDYKVKNYSKQKIKSENLVLELEKNPDIAASIGAVKGDRKLVIFSAETDNLIKNAKDKLKNKNGDLVIANDVTAEGAGFNVDTNIVTIIDKNGKSFPYGLLLKSEVADIILDHIIEL